MRRLTSIDEIRVGATIRVVDEEFEADYTVVVDAVTPAPEYGYTSVMVNNEYRVDVYEQDVFEV